MSAENEGGGNVDPELLYHPPAQKSVLEILKADEEDESLRKYKEQLLGSAAVQTKVIIDQDNPLNVLVRNLTLVVDGRPDITMNLTDVSKLNKETFILKEGTQYRLRIGFYVQREIVAGLKYVQKIYKIGIQNFEEVDKDECMVGSYAPKFEIQTYTTPVDEAPSGMMHRGTYRVKSLFTDDDNHEWLKWEWNLEIRKDWN